jgi:hypothetical protein
MATIILPLQIKIDEMKKTTLSFLVSAIALMSCSKEDSSISSTSSSQEILVSATPSTITSYISENYPDATISSVLKISNSDTTYEVTLSTWELLAFGHNEVLIGESLADTTLCDSIHDSIGDVHHHGGHHGNGHHRGGHGEGIHGGGISADSIPAAITEYVAANYAGYTVHNAMYDTVCPYGITINVMINVSDSLHHKLVFDASGLFIALAHRIKSADLPAIVSANVTANYSAYTLRKKAEVLTLSDNSKLYKVYLHQDMIRLSVIFKEDGTVVCEQ